MLDELLQEHQLGRVSGPYASPTRWPHQAVAPEGMPLRPCPDEQLSCSICFAVVQADKVRRCVDHKRSFHNSTVQCHDSPHHHGVDEHMKIAGAFHHLGFHHCETWCQDLAAAYRQFPLRCPSHGFTTLLTPGGPTLWQHHCLSFGATGSVWGFNRAADALCFLARQILAIPSVHYVDDFSATKPHTTSKSSFDTFEELFRALGMAQAPAAQQRLLGVQTRFPRWSQCHPLLQPTSPRTSPSN